MVPREPRKKSRKAVAGEEPTAAAPEITDTEWEGFFRRSVVLGAPVNELPSVRGDKAGQSLASGAIEAEVSARFRAWAQLAEDTGSERTDYSTAELAPYMAEELPPHAWAGLPSVVELAPGPAEGIREDVEATPTVCPSREDAPAAALTELEWRERFFQRGPLTGLMEGDDLLILTAPDVAGGVTSLRLRGDSLRTVAAAALQQDPAGFNWRDHDDLVLLGIVLDWSLRGVPLASRSPTVQSAVSGMAERYAGLIARLATLLPSR